MAKVFPAQLPQWILDEDRRAAEIKVFKKCVESFSDEWIVFYSRPWWGLTSTGGEKDGEADFILAHPDKGILFLEVKGGQISYDSTSEKWSSTDRNSITHIIKNPINQAMTSKHQILAKLTKEKNWPKQRVVAHYGVLFVDTKKPDTKLIAGYESELFCHAIEFDNSFADWVEKRLTSHVAPGEVGPGKAGINAMYEVLAKPIVMQTTLSRRFSSEMNNMAGYLTGVQFQCLGEIEANDRMVIQGGAGTGKTIIACELAIRSAETGKRTLLSCVAPALLNEFRTRLKGVKENLVIENISKIMNHNEKFDVVIVDESQDVDWDIVDKLNNLLSEETSKLVCFMDANQAIYRLATDLETRLKAKSFTLRVNLRNTKRIANVVDDLYEGPKLTIAGPEGVQPKMTIGKDKTTVMNQICDEVTHLNQKEGVPLSDIVVLSSDNEFLRKIRFVLNQKRIFHSDATAPAINSVTVDSVLNFKGLESPVVLLEATSESGNDRELSYVGTSRARTFLHVYTSDGNRVIAQAMKKG